MSNLSNVERRKIIDLLVKITKYSRRFFVKMHDDQLIAVSKKYISIRDDYIDSLCKLVDLDGNNICDYTRNQLLTFKIDRLEEIYNSYSNGFVCNKNKDEDIEHEYELLTPDELAYIYGLDYLEMDLDDFKKDGFVVIEENECSHVYDIKCSVIDEIKKLICDGKFCDSNGSMYTMSKLNKLTFERLVQLYRTLTYNLDEYPSYETLEGQMRLMKN